MSKTNLQKLGSVIRNFREGRGFSQDTLAKALNIPRPAVSQIENGERDLSFAEFNKLLELFEVSYEEFINSFRPKASTEPVKSKSTKNKNIKFNKEKLEQLILYILQKCGSKPNVGETVLYKLLYFCDFDFFELFEKPLTGMIYKRLQFGPVPEQKLYNPVIKEMVETGKIQKMNVPYSESCIQIRYFNFIQPDISAFTPEEINVIDKVINRLSDMSARQIEDHVHRDFPWFAHDDGEEIDYVSVFNRTGEFAQRDYENEVLNASNEDAFGSLPPMTKEEEEYYLNLPDKK